MHYNLAKLKIGLEYCQEHIEYWSVIWHYFDVIIPSIKEVITACKEKERRVADCRNNA